MKNFIALITGLVLISGSAFAGDCLNGSCRQSVKRVVSGVADVTRTVVSVPAKATRNVVSNIQSRRSFRRSY